MWPFDTPAIANEIIPPSACPVDPATRAAYAANTPPSPASGSNTPVQSQLKQQPPPPPREMILSNEKEVSSIPRWLPKSTAASAGASTAVVEGEVLACPARSAVAPSTSGETNSVAKTIPDASSTTPPLATLNSSTSTGAVENKDENWVYPSPQSFHSALLRKNSPNAEAANMPVVVPIHNAVNERVWEMVLDWEKSAIGSTEGVEGRKSKLVSFIGRPKDLSPRARFKGWIGYSAPFDRHDWIVDRPVPSTSTSTAGTDKDEEPKSIRIRYIIDFYTGRLPALLSPDALSSTNSTAGEKEMEGGRDLPFRPNLSFYLDVRPALDDLEGARMRMGRVWNGLFGNGQTAAGGK